MLETKHLLFLILINMMLININDLCFITLDTAIAVEDADAWGILLSAVPNPDTVMVKNYLFWTYVTKYSARNQFYISRVAPEYMISSTNRHHIAIKAHNIFTLESRHVFILWIRIEWFYASITELYLAIQTDVSLSYCFWK